MENPVTVVESGCDEGIDETLQEKQKERHVWNSNFVTSRSYNWSY